MRVTHIFISAVVVFMVTAIPSLVNADEDDIKDRETNEDFFMDFDDDSTTLSQPLEPLHLIVEPTPYELDRNQANEVLQTVNDLVEAFMESSEDSTFRNVQLGPITGIQFRPSGSSRRLRLRRSLTTTLASVQEVPDSSSSSRALNTFNHQGPATTLEISGGEVRYRENTPSAMSLKQLIQTAVNEHFAIVTPTILRSSGSTLEALGIQSISLTWESEGYTLAPSLTPVTPDSDPDDVTENINPTIMIGNGSTEKQSNTLQYSLFMGMLTTIMVVAALFVAKRRRRQLDGFRRDKVDGSGLEFVHDVNADDGAFPTFAPAGADKTSTHRHSNAGTYPKDPSDIEIAIPIGKEVESDISSLSSRGGDRRPQNSSLAPLSLNRVNDNEMYLGTSEGFDFLGGPERYPAHNPFTVASDRPTNLLGPTGESLWYSSSSASEDTSLQFDVNNDWNLDDKKNDKDREDSEAKIIDDELSPPISPPPKVTRKKDRKSKHNVNFTDHGICDNASDDQSSLGLRSIA